MKVSLNCKAYKFLSRELADLYSREIPRAVQLYLNNLAYYSRDDLIKVLESSFIIRTKGFVKRQSQYQKAYFKKQIKKMFSRTGTVPTKRSDAWAVQQFGEKPKKNRAGTMASRRGNKNRVMMRKARLRGDNMVLDASEAMQGLSGKMGALLAILRREGFQGLIDVDKKDDSKWSSGIYLFSGASNGDPVKSDISMVQEKDPKQPRKVDLLARLNIFTAKRNHQFMWSRAASTVISTRKVFR